MSEWFHVAHIVHAWVSVHAPGVNVTRGAIFCPLFLGAFVMNMRFILTAALAAEGLHAEPLTPGREG